VLTALALLVGYTGLFDVIVIGWMQVPGDVAAWVRMGLRVMVLWSAAIGWRRLWQGLLIRFNQTRKIGWGTLVRLAASGGSAIALAVWSRWPGVVIGATALMAGVLAEALYATWAAAPLLKHELGPASAQADSAPLTYGELFWFHLPLAGTSVLMLLVQPLVVASLTRLEHPVESLAAWPLIFQATLMARSPAMALPEVVIALTRGADSLAPVRRFALALAAASTALFAAFAFTPLASLYFARVQAASPEVAELARGGIVFFLGLPGLTILIAWLRGLLIKTRATKIVNAGMLVNLLVTVGVLALSVARNWPGLASAAIALNAAFVAELALLWWSTQRSIREIETAPN
jgi:hypothetical protein